MKPCVIPPTHSPAHVRGYITGTVAGWRKEQIVPGECPWIYGCVVAPVARRERAGEKETKRKQEESWLAGPDAGGWPTAAVGGSQTTRFERFTLQASTSGGGIDFGGVTGHVHVSWGTYDGAVHDTHPTNNA